MPQEGTLVARGKRWEAELIPVRALTGLVKYRYRPLMPPNGFWTEGHAQHLNLAMTTVVCLLGQDELLDPNELITWTRPETTA